VIPACSAPELGSIAPTSKGRRTAINLLKASSELKLLINPFGISTLISSPWRSTV